MEKESVQDDGSDQADQKRAESPRDADYEGQHREGDQCPCWFAVRVHHVVTSRVAFQISKVDCNTGHLPPSPPGLGDMASCNYISMWIRYIHFHAVPDLCPMYKCISNRCHEKSDGTPTTTAMTCGKQSGLYYAFSGKHYGN